MEKNEVISYFPKSILKEKRERERRKKYTENATKKKHFTNPTNGFR
jgi:hypothetical protein